MKIIDSKAMKDAQEIAKKAVESSDAYLWFQAMQVMKIALGIDN